MREPSRGRSLFAIGVITVAAAILWSWQLGEKSLFRDEAFTASTVLRPWTSLLRLSVDHEANGALHAFGLRVWSVLGDSEVVLRSFSVLALVALVPVVAAIAWRLTSSRVAILSSALFVLNGSVAANAQNARAYALSMLLAGIATLFFISEVEKPRRATLVCWAACCVLLTYAHLIGVLILVCHLASLWFLPVENRLWRRRLIASGAVLAAAVPLGVLISGHAEGQDIAAFRAGAYRDVLFTLSGRAGLVGVASAAIMAFFAFRVTTRTWRTCTHSREAWVQALLIAWAGLPFLLLTIASPVRPMIIGRYLLFSLPAIVIYGAVGIDDALLGSRGRSKLLSGIPLLLALTAGLLGISYWYSDGGSEDWRATSRYVFTSASPSDRILFANDSVRLFFEYYRPPIGSAALPQPVFPSQPWGHFGTGDQTYRSFGQDDLDHLTQDLHGRIWIVVGRNHVNTGEVDDMLRGLRDAYSVAERRVFEGEIEVIMLAPQ